MTAWLADALSYDKKCLHEGLVGCRSVQDLRVKMEREGAIGNSDCGNIFVYDKLRKEFPDAKFLVVWRDPGAVCESLKGIGLGYDVMPYAERAMARVLEDDHPIVLFEDVKKEGARIWNHCLNEPFDERRWNEKGNRIITCDVEARMKTVDLDAFAALVA